MFRLFRNKKESCASVDMPPDESNPLGITAEIIHQEPPFIGNDGKIYSVTAPSDFTGPDGKFDPALADEYYRGMSETSHGNFEDEIKRFDPFSVCKLDGEPALTMAQAHFAKYMDGCKVVGFVPYVYWKYQYGLNYCEWMTLLMGHDYLRVSTPEETLDFLTAEELKQILRAVQLPLTGKKADLVQRVRDAVSPEGLASLVPRTGYRYMLTSKGKDATSFIQGSIHGSLENYRATALLSEYFATHC